MKFNQHCAVHQINAEGASVAVELAEACRYRELLWMLVLRDIKVRYKQTVLGIAWVVLQPVTFVLVGLMLFRFVGKVPVDGPQPSLLLLSGALPWQLFANIVTRSSESIVENKSVLTKVYFPRILIPVASGMSAVMDFLVGCAVLLVWQVATGQLPGARALAVPFIVLAGCVAASGLGLALAALNARYRDFRYLVPFGLQLGLFLSPVFYTATAVPPSWKMLYDLNPNVGFIGLFRWALLGSPLPDIATLAIGAVVTVLLALLGVWFFARTQQQLADIV